jgi:hypothetical protein
LHKVEVLELGKVVEPLDVLDLVEGEVEGDELGEGVEAFDVCYKIVVEIYLCEGRGGSGRYVDGFEAILSQTETLDKNVSGRKGRSEVV